MSYPRPPVISTHHERLADGRWIALGMHCTCPDGYGIVTAYTQHDIQVATDVNNRDCFWSAKNVELAIPMQLQARGTR